MKENKNKILTTAIIALLIIIIGLFIILLLPDKEEANENESSLVDEKIDLEKVNETLSIDTTTPTPTYEVKSYTTEDGHTIEVVSIGKEHSEARAIEPHLFAVDEETAKKYSEINYYPEDCVQLILKNIDNTNLSISESKDTPLVYESDAYGDPGIFRVFDVLNTKENDFADRLAVDVETGEVFGITNEGIFYRYSLYDYNPDRIEELLRAMEEGVDYVTIMPFDKVELWKGLDAVINYEDYPTEKLRHFTDTDGTEYYKWTTAASDNYILADYYTGEMFQVVDGVRSSKITAFR